MAGGPKRASAMIAPAEPMHFVPSSIMACAWPSAPIGRSRPLDPLLTLYAATTRATLDGKYTQGWFPEQKVSIQEAIAAYTIGIGLRGISGA